MWVPYGNLDKLPVAVVNKDKPVTYNDKELKVGEKLVDKLKDEDSLCFNFVDQETAARGLKNGTYYMVITIPENFSENAIHSYGLKNLRKWNSIMIPIREQTTLLLK